ncbi:hypothetical protein BDZ45DRAFT_670084 [Acephala macrosclerotiorum]|nr:hypothetical protein BDZ45DRAFT_670084 [Acephala macrosclerotiorum]
MTPEFLPQTPTHAHVGEQASKEESCITEDFVTSSCNLAADDEARRVSARTFAGHRALSAYCMTAQKQRQ